MAEMFFLGDAYNYETDVLVTHINATDHLNVNDKDINTYATWNVATGTININLREPKRARHFFMRVDNARNFTLRYSSDGNTYNDVPYDVSNLVSNATPVTPSTTTVSSQVISEDGNVYLFNFTPQEFQYWQLVLNRRNNSQAIKLYELRLMEFAKAFENLDEQPSIYDREIIDFNDASYRLANGRLVVYEGNAVKNRINFEWEYLQNKPLIDELREFWTGPPQKPTLDVIPDTFDSPFEILRCRWNSDFDFNYSGESKPEGFRIFIELQEL